MKLAHAVLILFYMILQWLVSGLSRSVGMWLCATGMLAFALALLAMRLGWQRPLFVVYFCAINIALFVGSGEAVLRLAPGVLRGWIANEAYGGYHCLAGGIYERDCRLGYALKPSTSTTLYWNGHWWRHETNAAAYRGDQVERADAVFLGDSMIYGHGVENAQTVPSQYGAQGSQSVANLGQQGTCLVQMCARLRAIGTPLRPQVVFVCCHFNDIAEAGYWYSTEELQRFLAASGDYEPLARIEFHPRPWWRADQHIWNAHVAPSLRLAGALDAGYHLLGNSRLRKAVATGPAVPYVPSAEKLNEPFAPGEAAASSKDRLEWKVHCHAAACLKELCAASGARMVLFDIGYPHAFSHAMEQLAKRLRVNYSPAGRTALVKALSGDDIYLANDGHWSAAGCAFVAAELAKTNYGAVNYLSAR